MCKSLGSFVQKKNIAGLDVVVGKKRFAAGMGAGRVWAGLGAGMGPIAPVFGCVTMSRLGV